MVSVSYSPWCIVRRAIRTTRRVRENVAGAARGRNRGSSHRMFGEEWAELLSSAQRGAFGSRVVGPNLFRQQNLSTHQRHQSQLSSIPVSLSPHRCKFR